MSARGQCLPATQRLKTPSQFQFVYKNKQWGNSQLFTFNVLATKTAFPVLGVTVSKKVSKRAVDRNRLKRQIKEYFRLNQDQLGGAQVVITAKPKAMNASDQERNRDLAELWVKLLRWQRWHTRKENDSTTANTV